MWAKPQKYETILFDLLKTSIIFAGILGHLAVCAEMPLGYLVLGKYLLQKIKCINCNFSSSSSSFYSKDRHDVVNYFFSSIETQIALNDAGLTGVPMFSGIATALIAYPLALKSKLPFFPAIIDRALR